MNKPKIAVVVHACDKYQLLFRGFSYFFGKYWPIELPDFSFSLYFLTENVEIEDTHFNIIKTGTQEWSERLRTGLNQISEEYIIYFQEDMWLKEEVDADTLEQVLAYTFMQRIEHLKLHNSDYYFPHHTETIINGLPLSVLDNTKSEFLLSHQITLWKKSVLLKQMPKVETALQSETDGLVRIRKENLPVHQISLIRGNETIDEGSIGMPAQSLYFAISSGGSLNKMALPFIHELFQSSDDKIVAYAKTLQYHYDNHLTHDGKPVPQPNPMLKRVKEIAKFILRKG